MAARYLLSSVVRSRASLFSSRTFASTARLSSASADMFCFQCEQTENGTGCTTVGVCGKTPEVASLQDALVHGIKGMSMWAHRARELGAPEDSDINHFTLDALFSTLTNVNFDQKRFRQEYIPMALSLRDKARKNYEAACAKQGKTPENLVGTAATWTPSEAELSGNDKALGVLTRRASVGVEAGGLQELITYGLKGVAAYAAHAQLLGKEDTKTYAAMQAALSFLGNDNDASKDRNQLLGEALKVGAANIGVLAMLEDGHTGRFGHPTPAEVLTSPISGKCLLVSGHDMTDLEQILQQTEGTGINVYTHGELLPAHGYPGLRKYKHLVGNYGGPWQLQKFEFAKFPGPIVVTTNCLIEPRKTYQDRIYTTNAVGFNNIKHIRSDGNGRKDYSQVVQQALELPGFTQTGVQTKVTTGFGYNTVMSVADKVIKGVEDGHITRIFFIGGCDGSESERSYFRDLALSTPASSLVLTAGCGKYRFNRYDFGTVPNVGIPRMIDMGQCNDSYGAVKVALALADHFKTDVNGLPLTLAVSWFEQKAVAILLSLLHLGVKNITLGPNLPAFVGPETTGFLVSALGLRKTGDADSDLSLFVGKK